MDLDAARMVWAVDAVIPNSDGPFAGGLNFFFYDDPVTGKFDLLIWDLDNTFWRLPFDTDPYTWHKEVRFYGRPMYDLTLADPEQFSAYVADIDEVLDHAYEPDRLTARIDEWTAQIQEHAFEDPNKPFSNTRYLEAVGDMRQFVRRRHDYLRAWTGCWKSGGTDDGHGRCVEP
ncbi:MAG: spore coat protein CotH [Kiritimatiellia bacterium]